MNPELARRNLRFGWALFVLFWLIFAGTILVAVLYLQLDCPCARPNPATPDSVAQIPEGVRFAAASYS